MQLQNNEMHPHGTGKVWAKRGYVQILLHGAVPQGVCSSLRLVSMEVAAWTAILGFPNAPKMAILLPSASPPRRESTPSNTHPK